MLRRWQFVLLASASALAGGAGLSGEPLLPDPAALRTIDERADHLSRDLAELRRLGVPDSILADIEVYLKAATFAVRHGELSAPGAPADALAALDRGLLRASQQARGESPWLSQAGFAVARGYRSRVDGSVQPYAVTFPAEYGKDPRRRWRVDVVLHGRDDSLNEVKFLRQENGEKPAPASQSFVRVDVFGRGNNGYRWAGECDVLEAFDAFLASERALNRANLLDPARVVLRGFSMGGAGTWHLGLHRPDRWCAISPGAGFTLTHGYVGGLPDKLPAEQEACLTIYDAADYSENAADVPVVAFAGQDDPQRRALENVRERLAPLGIPMTLLVAAGVGHRFPPEWQDKVEAEVARHADTGRPEYPKRVRFVTYTMKYPGTDWVQVLGLEEHYRRAAVDAELLEDGYAVKTTNVRAFNLRLAPGATRQSVKLAIDGQSIEARPYQSSGGELHLYLEKRGAAWECALPERIVTGRLRRAQKILGLQGPIDDAFAAPFLCVRGTGKPWHEATADYAAAGLRRFEEEWSKFFRGDLPVKDDVDVTPEEIASRNLVLFGDPASNALVAQVLPGLPLTWSRERIGWRGVDFDAATHVPVLVYPSPLSTEHYVVLNSGHTFHAADFRGSNALLYPRLGDFAVVRLKGDKNDPLASEVLEAGLFDDFWKWPRRQGPAGRGKG